MGWRCSGPPPSPWRGRWHRGAGGWRWGWAAALALAEYLRGQVFTGFPWALPAYIWSEGNGLQLAQVTGAYGLTWVTLLLVALAVPLALRPGRLWPLALLVPWLLPLGLGALLVRPDPIPGDAPVLRLVQPNAPQHQKWDPDYAPIFFQRQLQATTAPGDPDLVIWPETAIPYRLDPGQPGPGRGGPRGRRHAGAAGGGAGRGPAQLQLGGGDRARRAHRGAV